MRFVWAIALVSCASLAVTADEAARNPVYEHLVREGVPIDDETVKLPEPSMAADAGAEDQTKVVREIAAKKYDYDRFVHRSAVAPFLLQINTAGEASGGDRVQRIDLWFVAYGKLADITDEDLLGQLIGGRSGNSGESEKKDADADPDRGDSEALSDDELRERDLSVNSIDSQEESYFRVDSPLLEKVRISGIGHGFTTHRQNSVLAASLLDPRFGDDPKYPNRWRPIVRDPSGGKKLGKPHPYAGFGGYCQVVELAEPRGALFIECHMAINEPHGWFNGTNLLRSKLPVLMQDNVRTLRRKLAK